MKVDQVQVRMLGQRPGNSNTSGVISTMHIALQRASVHC